MTINDINPRLRSELVKYYCDADEKKKKQINSAYLRWLANKPCVISRRQPVELHHWREAGFGFPVGMRLKPPDILAVPLHPEYHRGKFGIHQIGKKTFVARFGFDPVCAILTLHDEFIEFLTGTDNAKR